MYRSRRRRGPPADNEDAGSASARDRVGEYFVGPADCSHCSTASCLMNLAIFIQVRHL